MTLGSSESADRFHERTTIPANNILSVAWLMGRYGGAHRYLESLVSALLATNYRVEVVVNRNPLLAEFIDTLKTLGARVHEVDMSGTADSIAAQLDQIIREVKPDLLHVNSGSKVMIKAALKMASLMSPASRACYTMHSPLVRRREEELPLRMQDRLPFSRHRRNRNRMRRFAELFDRIISVSSAYGQILGNEFPSVHKRTVSIANGVDLGLFSLRNGDASTESTLVVGGCGNLVRVKRFDVLIRAVQNLSESHDIELRIAGEGPERENLEKLIANGPNPEKIQLLGYQSDVRGFFRSLDLFSMTSDREAFPYAQLEAMATGLPSVVTTVGDLPIMVRDGSEGIVIPTGSWQDCADGLAKLAKEVELRKQMGRNARNRIQEEYTEEKCLERTLAVFNELLTSKTANN